MVRRLHLFSMCFWYAAICQSIVVPFYLHHRERADYAVLCVLVLQMLASAGRWVLSTASLLSSVAKLMLLLFLELGCFPLAAGVWLDICALPLTRTPLEVRLAFMAKAPFLSGFMHWVVGVGFMLGLTFLVCLTREVLRPGALPILIDPTNPDRNPVRDMIEEPLLKHLARLVVAGGGYAGLCVVLVHLPALLAQQIAPQLLPLHIQLFDPLTHIPADMLLFHIFIPFTVEHVRVKAFLKEVVGLWLQFAGWCLGWTDYLLLQPMRDGEEERRVGAAAAVPPAAAVAGHVYEEGAGAGAEREVEGAGGAAAAEQAALPVLGAPPVGEVEVEHGLDEHGAQQQQEEGQHEEATAAAVEGRGRADESVIAVTTGISSRQQRLEAEVVDEKGRQESGVLRASSVDQAAATAVLRVIQDEAAGQGGVLLETNGECRSPQPVQQQQQESMLELSDLADPAPQQQQEQEDQQEQQQQQREDQQQQVEQQRQGEEPVPPPQQQQQEQQEHHTVQWYHQQPDYKAKLLALGLIWLVSCIVLNALLLVLPIGLGRWLFRQLLLPFKNDLFTGAVGALVLWGGVSLARCWVKAASFRNIKAMASAGLRWGLLVCKCGLLVVLWLGVVATMLGMLCELVLLPLRLPPNQTALIYLYQVSYGMGGG